MCVEYLCKLVKYLTVVYSNNSIDMIQLQHQHGIELAIYVLYLTIVLNFPEFSIFFCLLQLKRKPYQIFNIIYDKQEPLINFECSSLGLESWLFDSGELTVKEHLPVRQLRIGDTGSPLDGKKARYTLGPLICEGDSKSSLCFGVLCPDISSCYMYMYPRLFVSS